MALAKNWLMCSTSTNIGGIVTKSVTYDPRGGNAAPRVVEAGNAMLNSVGLANPGVDAVCSEKIPWMKENLSSLQVFVSVAGHVKDEYCAVVKRLEETGGFLGYELNLSCPNDVKLGGLPFALDQEALQEVVSSVRELTDRPILVKLAPNVPDIGLVSRAAQVSGADGVTLINTIPGLTINVHSQKAELGAGKGGSFWSGTSCCGCTCSTLCSTTNHHPLDRRWGYYERIRRSPVFIGRGFFGTGWHSYFC